MIPRHWMWESSWYYVRLMCTTVFLFLPSRQVIFHKFDHYKLCQTNVKDSILKLFFYRTLSEPAMTPFPHDLGKFWEPFCSLFFQMFQMVCKKLGQHFDPSSYWDNVSYNIYFFRMVSLSHSTNCMKNTGCSYQRKSFLNKIMLWD